MYLLVVSWERHSVALSATVMCVTQLWHLVLLSVWLPPSCSCWETWGHLLVSGSVLEKQPWALSPRALWRPAEQPTIHHMSAGNNSGVSSS